MLEKSLVATSYSFQGHKRALKTVNLITRLYINWIQLMKNITRKYQDNNKYLTDNFKQVAYRQLITQHLTFWLVSTKEVLTGILFLIKILFILFRLRRFSYQLKTGKHFNDFCKIKLEVIWITYMASEIRLPNFPGVYFAKNN